MYKINKNLNLLIRKRSGFSKTNKRNYLYLDRNEKNQELSNIIKKKLFNSLSNSNLGFYPDFNKFYKKLSTWSKVNEQEIFLTEGVSGAIKNLIEVYCDKTSNIIVPEPTFAMYDVYAKMFNIRKKLYKYNSNYILNYKEILRLIDKNTSIIFLPCPNIPVDTEIDKKILEQILLVAKKNHIIVALDEVYFLFTKFNGLKYFQKFKNNLVIMRSFSKAFGLAGIRLGYLISSKKNIEYISKVRTGYESNTLSIKVAEYFLSNMNITKKYIFEIKEGLKYLKEELDKNNIKNFGGLNSNYIFIDFENMNYKKKIYKKLIKNNIILRNNWAKPFDKGLLVSGTNKKNMKKLLFILLKK